jgi:thiol-disulfide isomerase/thioredoxin
VLLISRRLVLAAGGTLAAALIARKPRAEELDDAGSALEPTNPPVPAPNISFQSADGSDHHLADFIGHGMVINLWATWCAPCVEELPSLAKLSKTLAPDDIAVLPLSSDRGGAQRVEAFFQQHNITGLPVLLDPHSATAHALHVSGIPTSIIIDKKGREVARLEGSADWSTPAAARRIRKLVTG